VHAPGRLLLAADVHASQARCLHSSPLSQCTPTEPSLMMQHKQWAPSRRTMIAHRMHPCNAHVGMLHVTGAVCVEASAACAGQHTSTYALAPGNAGSSRTCCRSCWRCSGCDRSAAHPCVTPGQNEKHTSMRETSSQTALQGCTGQTVTFTSPGWQVSATLCAVEQQQQSLSRTKQPTLT
jgi:hypothetical protein